MKSRKSATRVRIGPAGWSYPDWEGIVYPTKKPRGFDRLLYLSSYFDTIEVNVTFYRLVDKKTVLSWRERVRDRSGFRFTVKLFRGFTHEGTTGEGEMSSFRESMEPLLEEGILGALLLQFPWSFKPTEGNIEYLDSLLTRLRDFPRAVEMRHAGWNEEEFLRFLRDRGAGFCNVDQPPARDSIPLTAHGTGPIGYLRLHGRNIRAWFDKEAGRDERYNYLYGEEELEGFVEKSREIAESSIDVFIISNNHFKGKAACNALQLSSKIRGGKVRVPPTLLRAYPELSSIALEADVDPSGQLSMF